MARNLRDPHLDQVLIIAALCEHHGYADGKVINRKPISYSAILDSARKRHAPPLGFSPTIVSRVFRDLFDGYRGYKYLCWTNRIGYKLKRLTRQTGRCA